MSSSPRRSIESALFATARIRFEEPERRVALAQTGPDHGHYIEQQRALLASRSLLMRAVHAAGVNAAVRTVACASSDTVRTAGETYGIVETLRVTHAAAAQAVASSCRVRLRMVAETQYELWSGSAWFGVGTFDVPFRAHGLRLTVSRAPRHAPQPGDEHELEISPLHVAVPRARAKLSIVALPIAATGAAGEIELTYRDPSTARAREFLRSLILSYVELRRERRDRKLPVSASFAPGRLEKTVDVQELSAHVNALIKVADQRPSVLPSPVSAKVAVGRAALTVAHAAPKPPRLPTTPLAPTQLDRPVAARPSLPEQPARPRDEVDELLGSADWSARGETRTTHAVSTPQPFFRDAHGSANRERSAWSELGLAQDRELMERLLKRPVLDRRWFWRGAAACAVILLVRGLMSVGATHSTAPATMRTTIGAAAASAPPASSNEPRIAVPMMTIDPILPVEPARAEAPRPAADKGRKAVRAPEQRIDDRRPVAKPPATRGGRIVNVFGPHDFDAPEYDEETYYSLPAKVGPLPVNPY